MTDWLKDTFGNALVQRWLGSLARQALTLASGYLVTKGLLTDEQSASLVASMAPVLVSIAWGLYQKYVDRLKFLAARELPSTATSSQIEAKAGTRAIKTQAFA